MIVSAINPGDRFGNLIIIERDYSQKTRFVSWLCLCDCGEKCIKRGVLLKKGQYAECRKCTLRKNVDARIVIFKKMIGMSYGNFDILDFVRLDFSYHANPIFKVRCKSCQKERELHLRHMKLDYRKSCGCKQSNSENYLLLPKFSDLDIGAIRDLFKSGLYSKREMITMFDISKAYLDRILNDRVRVQKK